MRTGMMAGAALVALGVAHPARTEPPLAVSVHCPELSDEELAHVEAMVRADLLARASRITFVKFECQTTWVTAEFYFDRGSSVSRGQPKASSAPLIAEQLILLPDGLRAEELGSTEEASTTMSEPSVPSRSAAVPSETSGTPMMTDNSPGPGAPTSAIFGAASSPREQTPISVNALTSTDANRVARATLPQWTRTNVSLTGTVVPRRAVKSVQNAMRFEALAGAEVEPMLKKTDGMVGPIVGFGAELDERFVLRMTATVLWAIDAPDDYGLRDHRGAIGFEYRAHSSVTMGASALLTTLRVSAPTGATESYRWSPIEPGCQVHIGYRWNFGSFRIEVRPILTLYGHARVVRRDFVRVLELPLLLGGIVAQTSFTL